VVKEKQYETFGNLVSSSGTFDDNREFTGKEKDPTGFHYFGARYYSGDIGRFLSPDPHTLSPGGFELTDPQTLNPYVYCTNDPLYYFDPEGLYRTQRNNIVYPVTHGVVAFETGFSMIPIFSLGWVAVRHFGLPDDPHIFSGEFTTGADWVWGILGAGGAPTNIPGGAVTATGVAYALNGAANDRITLGMFAAKHRETVISGGRIDLNKIYPDKMGTKNKAVAIELAKRELRRMENFAIEIRKGRTPEWIVENGLAPSEYLKYYNIYMNNQKVGSYRGGIYYDKDGLVTAEQGP